MVAPVSHRKPAAPVLLGQGDQAVIELDPTSMIVRKTFSAQANGLAATHVNREVQYLSEYSRALADLAFLRCPEPVCAEPQQGTFWMTFCEGYRLDRALAEANGMIEPHIDHIAEQAAIALEAYIRAFDEPYLDFTTANILFDPVSRVVSLVDLGDPQIYFGYDFQDVKYDLSIGNFISSTTYHTLRPRAMWNFGYWRRQKRLTLALVRIVGGRNRLRPEIIWRVQADKYNAHANHGNLLRRSWFLTLGKLMYWWRVTSIIDVLEG